MVNGDTLRLTESGTIVAALFRMGDNSAEAVYQKIPAKFDYTFGAADKGTWELRREGTKAGDTAHHTITIKCNGATHYDDGGLVCAPVRVCDKETEVEMVAPTETSDRDCGLVDGADGDRHFVGDVNGNLVVDAAGGGSVVVNDRLLLQGRDIFSRLKEYDDYFAKACRDGNLLACPLAKLDNNFTSCLEAYSAGVRRDGLYTLAGENEPVPCILSDDEGGWRLWAQFGKVGKWPTLGKLVFTQEEVNLPYTGGKFITDAHPLAKAAAPYGIRFNNVDKWGYLYDSKVFSCPAEKSGDRVFSFLDAAHGAGSMTIRLPSTFSRAKIRVCNCRDGSKIVDVLLGTQLISRISPAQCVDKMFDYRSQDEVTIKESDANVYGVITISYILVK